MGDHCTPTLCDTSHPCKKLSEQVASLFLVDNTSHSDSPDSLQAEKTTV